MRKNDVCFFTTIVPLLCYARKERHTDQQKEYKGCINYQSLWKKPSYCFEEHQQTHYHKSTASYHPTCKDISEITNGNLVNVREKERIYFM